MLTAPTYTVTAIRSGDRYYLGYTFMGGRRMLTLNSEPVYFSDVAAEKIADRARQDDTLRGVTVDLGEQW